MNTIKIAAIVLIIAGVLKLVYGGFSYYIKETHGTMVVPNELSVKDRQMVYIPVWVGVGAIMFLLLGSKNS